jgi:SAM-dependent methyltransferase
MESIQRDFPGARLSGFDVSPVAVGHTRTRGFGNAIEANVHLIPCTDLSHDAVVSLDLLYHEGVDQEQAMREFWRVLVPGGRLIMNLPAFECLRGQHDVAVKNARRYSPRQVRELHQRHGFTVERLFCWNAWLFLPVLLWRKMSRKIAGASNDKAKSDLSPLNPALNRLLSFAGEAEAALCRAVRSPLGTSVFSVAIKNEIR